MPVDNTFRDACRPGGKEDKQRMIERNPRKGDLLGLKIGYKITGADRVLKILRLESRTRKGNNHGLFQTLQRGLNILDLGQAIHHLPVIIISVNGNQNLRLNLPETVNHPCTPKSGEAEDQIAPRETAARAAIIVSGMLGR